MELTEACISLKICSSIVEDQSINPLHVHSCIYEVSVYGGQDYEPVKYEIIPMGGSATSKI
jgi:hypothetical protein